MRYRGWFKITTPRGTWIVKNQETNRLRTITVTAWNGTQLNAFQYIAIGTDDTIPDPAQTALFAEVIRLLATVTIETTAIAGDTLHLLAQFVPNVTLDIFEMGIFNAAVGGDMAARAVNVDSNGDPSAFNINTGEGITLEYYLQAL